MQNNDLLQYKDILNIPYPKSDRHPQMTLLQRSAQFAPFAALTGFGGEITKSAERITEEMLDNGYDADDYYL